MIDEMNNLESNGAHGNSFHFLLFDLVSCQWVFATKLGLDDQVDSLTRLVAGYKNHVWSKAITSSLVWKIQQSNLVV
jgi:hypothetical protein